MNLMKNELRFSSRFTLYSHSKLVLINCKITIFQKGEALQLKMHPFLQLELKNS